MQGQRGGFRPAARAAQTKKICLSPIPIFLFVKLGKEITFLLRGRSVLLVINIQ